MRGQRGIGDGRMDKAKQGAVEIIRGKGKEKIKGKRRRKK
jgi:hypothetical protein